MSPSSTNPTNPKAEHYRHSLTQALLRGAWAESTPGTAPKGTELSWGELVRKWGKHTGGNVSLIHNLRDISLLYLSTTSHSNTSSSGYITVPPSSTAAPGSGSSNSSNDAPSNETATSASASSFVHIPHPHHNKGRASVDVTPHSGGGGSSSGHTYRQETGRAAYLSPGDLDGDDSLDDESWGIEANWWAGVGSERVEEVKEGVKSLEGLLASNHLRPEEIKSAKLNLAYHYHSLGSHDRALELYSQCDWTEPLAGVVHGDAATVERIRGKCRQGISYELSSTPNLTLALEAYLSTIPLLSYISSFPTPTAPYLLLNPSQTPKIPFDSHRELHRNLSTALTRAAIISSRLPNDLVQTLRILRTYHALSYGWPSNFRPIQRQRMLLLYLRGLLASYPPVGAPSDTPYLLTGATSTLPARTTWTSETVEAIRLGRQLLAMTTSFPRAGSVNSQVTKYCDLVVALYDVSSSLSKEAISTLWWAMTLTFQSQSILRQLTRVLANSGDHKIAKKTFELYVQLVLKARETQQPESSLQLKRRPSEDAPAGPEEIKRRAEQAPGVPESSGDQVIEERKAQVVEGEIDGDEVFVDALLVGARLLVKDLGDPEEGWRYVSLAGDVVVNADMRGRGLGDTIKARMEECKGIVRMAMASQCADMITRPTYQAQAIDHLKASTTFNPSSPSAYYHLAYSQAEARQIDAAIDSTRTTLELDSSNVQAWHLLCLLLTAQGDWKGAVTAGEAGVGVWESSEGLEISESLKQVTIDPTVECRDFAIATPKPTVQNTKSTHLLHSTGHILPLPQTPLKMPTSKSKSLEQVIQLRMTLNIISEKIQGPETAMLKQQELFAFFSARSGRQRVGGTSAGSGTGGSTSFVGSVRARSVGPETGTGTGVTGQAGGTGGNGVGNAGLGESYVAVNETAPGPRGLGESMVAVHPPTPDLSSSLILAPKVPQIITPAITTGSSSPADSVTASEGEGESDANGRGVRRKHLGPGKKLIPRHLHVPGVGRAGSLRRGAGGSVSNVSIDRYRSTSASSTAISLAPTAVHSHYRAISKAPSPTPPPPSATPSTHTPSEARILSNLWLMSSATFRRWSKPEQCLVAISEAETLDPENPDVWVQLGLYHSSLGNTEEALKSFTKSLLLLPDYPTAVVSLSKLYLSRGGKSVELAHGLLNQLTQAAGWDSAEAWFYLARVCEAQGGRSGRVKECLEFALGLERSKCCRRIGEAVERWS